MKSLSEYLTETKIDDKLAKEIVDDAIANSSETIDKNLIYKAFDRCDYDMNTVVRMLDKAGKSKEFEHVQLLLDEIWIYLEDNYKEQATNYNAYIIQNLDRFI